MHSFGLIHKDIKPENIAYSPSLKDYVFLDFGVSTFAMERPGDCSWTLREGTFKYMSPEMKNLGVGSGGLIDLYYNDLYSLRASLKEIEKK